MSERESSVQFVTGLGRCGVGDGIDQSTPGGASDAHALEIVFVCGSSRSGTTVTSRILDRSPDVHTMEELHFFEGIWDPADTGAMTPDEAGDALARLVGIERSGFRHPAPPEQCREEASTILGRLQRPSGPQVYAGFVAHRAAMTGARIVCDQTPRNVYLLGQLLEWFPLAQAVIVVRDPRDVLLSQKNRWRRRQRGIDNMSRRDQLRLWAGYHPITMSQLWRSAAVVAIREQSHPRVHVVRFEDLVASPQTTVTAMCEAIGVDFDPALLDVVQSGSSHGPMRAGTRGLDGDAVGRWRRGGLDDVELAIADRLTVTEREAFGYAPSGAVCATWRQLVSSATLPVKGALALALNLSRSRRLIRAMKRRWRRGPLDVQVRR